MKKIIAGVLSVTLMFGSLALPAAESGITLFDTTITADAEVYGDFAYAVLDDGTVEITGYTGQGGDVEIPKIINRKKVTSIGKKAFEYCYDLTNITIPYGVVSIGENAFFGCSDLESITIPRNTTNIADNAFDNCRSITSINVDENNSAYSSVNGILFSKDKTKLIKYPAGNTSSTYSIPDGTKILGISSFSHCKYLESVTIPNSVYDIEKKAFSFCYGLKEVEIPNSVSIIRTDTFYDCTHLESVTIPDSVKTIENCAFYCCLNLREVTIPKTVTRIGGSAFGYYLETSLRKVANFKIRCYFGSAGDKYAQENEFDFEYLDSDAPDLRIVTTTGFSCTTTAVRINWNKVKNASGYRVYLQNNSTKKWEKVATLSGGNTLTYRQNGLNPGTKYYFKVKAYMKSDGNTYWGVASKAMTTITKPKAVKFTRISTGKTAVRLRWTMINCYGYEVQMYNTQTKKWEYVKGTDHGPTTVNKETGFMEQTERRISGLKKNKSYKFRVRAYSKVFEPVYKELFGEWTYVTVRTRA